MNTMGKLKSFLAGAIAAVGLTAAVTAQAEPTLVVNSVTQSGGVATVNYTASGLSGYNIANAKFVFEITANGTTKAFTNANAVTEGSNTAQVNFKPAFNVDFLRTMDFDARISGLVEDATAPTLEITSVTQAGGIATVSYTASGLEDYNTADAKFVFEITLNGTTKAFTNANAVVEGPGTAQVDFKAAFGNADSLDYANYHARIVGLVDPEPTVGPTGVPIPGYVRLWQDGPAWATWNVGAAAPEQAGYYFWWGDTKGYVRGGAGWRCVDGSSVDFRFFDTNNKIVTYGMSLEGLTSGGWIDASGNLTPQHDAARVHFGGTWRMPTADEIQNLVANTTTEWVTQNGVSGYRFTGKGAFASKSIFIPAAGQGTRQNLKTGDNFTWSSTPSADAQYPLYSGCLCFTSSSLFMGYNGFRFNGFPVRAVRDSH